MCYVLMYYLPVTIYLPVKNLYMYRIKNKLNVWFTLVLDFFNWSLLHLINLVISAT